MKILLFYEFRIMLSKSCYCGDTCLRTVAKKVQITIQDSAKRAYPPGLTLLDRRSHTRKCERLKTPHGRTRPIHRRPRNSIHRSIRLQVCKNIEAVDAHLQGHTYAKFHHHHGKGAVGSSRRLSRQAPVQGSLGQRIQALRKRAQVRPYLTVALSNICISNQTYPLVALARRT